MKDYKLIKLRNLCASPTKNHSSSVTYFPPALAFCYYSAVIKSSLRKPQREKTSDSAFTVDQRGRRKHGSVFSVCGVVCLVLPLQQCFLRRDIFSIGVFKMGCAANSSEVESCCLTERRCRLTCPRYIFLSFHLIRNLSITVSLV